MLLEVPLLKERFRAKEMVKCAPRQSTVLVIFTTRPAHTGPHTETRARRPGAQSECGPACGRACRRPSGTNVPAPRPAPGRDTYSCPAPP